MRAESGPRSTLPSRAGMRLRAHACVCSFAQRTHVPGIIQRNPGHYCPIPLTEALKFFGLSPFTNARPQAHNTPPSTLASRRLNDHHGATQVTARSLTGSLDYSELEHALDQPAKILQPCYRRWRRKPRSGGHDSPTAAQ